MNGWIGIIIVLLIGYVLGVYFPGPARQIGIA